MKQRYLIELHYQSPLNLRRHQSISGNLMIILFLNKLKSQEFHITGFGGFGVLGLSTMGI